VRGLVEPILRATGLTKRYGDATVLDAIDIELPARSVTLLTGRSGSGKSTLFKLLAAIDRPTSGKILLEGVDLTQLDDEDLSSVRLHRVGLVFQSFNLLSDLSAHENVRLPLDLAGEPRAAADARAKELLEVVGVAHRASARPQLLSGGEQQRVAVARALVNRPALLLADEPTGNLDRKNAEMVFELLRNVNEALGTAMLIITHDELARPWFPRRLVIEDGRFSRLASASDAAAPARPTPPA
jgi:ABC-type lipoprotein export system ATPase subunit